MPGDDTSSIIYTAIVEEIEQGRKRIRLNIDEIGDAFITRKVWPRQQMKMGEKLEVKISHHLPTKRWLVSDIISIEGEPYEMPQSEPVKKEPSVENKTKKGKEEAVFPNLDQRYVQNTASSKKKKRMMQNYGLNLHEVKFLKKWEQSSNVNISNYLEEYEIIPSHPESKFSGRIIRFNLTPGWQGFIWCPELNSLVYTKHTRGRLSGSIDEGAEVAFYLGTEFDNRGEIQFVAREWESSINRGHAPEPALSFDFENLELSKQLIEDILQDQDQFVMITSYRSRDKQSYTSNEILSYLNDNYPCNPVKELKWPLLVNEFGKKIIDGKNQSESARYSHPLIAKYLSGSVILFPPVIGGEEE
jgi:hypothetical protein